MDDKHKILGRVRRLYAMAQQGGSSPNEAEIALRRCIKLMDEHGITEADLIEKKFSAERTDNSYTRIPSYVRFLGAAVAELHDCVCISTADGHLEFRGFHADAGVAALTFDYLMTAMQKSLLASRKTGDVRSGRMASTDYRNGFVKALTTRVLKIVRERTTPQQTIDDQRYALVLRKRDIVQRELTNDVTRTSSARMSYRLTPEAVAGYDAGNRVSLNSQLAEPKPKTRIS